MYAKVLKNPEVEATYFLYIVFPKHSKKKKRLRNMWNAKYNSFEKNCNRNSNDGNRSNILTTAATATATNTAIQKLVCRLGRRQPKTVAREYHERSSIVSEWWMREKLRVNKRASKFPRERSSNWCKRLRLCAPHTHIHTSIERMEKKKKKTCAQFCTLKRYLYSMHHIAKLLLQVIISDVWGLEL